MINIVIEERDRYFASGLESAFSQLFMAKYCRAPAFFHEVNNGTMPEMDIIVLSINTGDNVDCLWPALALRKTRSLIIGFYEKTMPVRVKKPLFCLSKVLWLDKRCTINELALKVIQAWRETLIGNGEVAMRDCARCSRLRLTEQQRRIAWYMLHGFSIAEIAAEMKINSKTVSVHKYFMMDKLSLHSNQQFLAFLHRKNRISTISLE